MPLMTGLDLYERRMGYDGMSRAELARRLGITSTTLALWENGDRAVPDWLADWLDFMDNEIFMGRVPPPVPRRAEDRDAILYPRTSHLQREKRRIKRERRAAWRERVEALEGRAKRKRLKGRPKATETPSKSRQDLRQENREALERRRREVQAAIDALKITKS